MMADIKAIRERVEKATPGPWGWDLYYIVGRVPKGRPGGEVIGEMRATVDRLEYPLSQRKADAEFIAHARQDIPDLLEKLLGAGEAEEDTLYEALDKIQDICSAVQAEDGLTSKEKTEIWMIAERVMEPIDKARAALKGK